MVVSVKTAQQLAQGARRGHLKDLGELLDALRKGEPYQTYAGTAVGNLTPNAIGEWAFDTTNSTWYKATGLTNTSWACAAIAALSATEQALLDTALAGTVVASKVVVYSAAGGVARQAASVTAASSDQAGAAAMTAEFNSVTAANDAKGVKLPTAAANLVIEVINTVRTASLKVYPATGGQINALGANAAYTIKPGQRVTFVGKSATLWHAAVSPLGDAVTDKVGFYGVTPVVQPASASQAAFTAQTLTAIATATLSEAKTGMWAYASSTVGKSVRTQLNKVIIDVPKLKTELTAIHAALVALGAIKGGA